MNRALPVNSTLYPRHFHKFFIVAVCICAIGLTGYAPQSASASPAAYAPPVTHRVDIIFNTDWKYNQRDVTGAEVTVYNDSAWTYVDLPHTTKFVTPDDPAAYLGVSWYRKHFTVDSAYQGRKVYVEFEAAMQVADVWINGTSMAHHEGGTHPLPLTSLTPSPMAGLTTSSP